MLVSASSSFLLTDVLVIGGGPAGLAAAIALRQHGVDVTVVDARPAAIDKACGEGLMPEALTALERLGVSLDAQDGVPFRGIRFEDVKTHVEAVFPSRAGLGVRRLRLHERLRGRAEEAGAHLLWETRCQLAGPQSALLNGEEIRFRVLVGADGQSSQVRAWAGLDARRVDRLRYGFRRHYRVKPWTDRVEVHWAERGQLYLTPVAEDCVCVAFVGREPMHEDERWQPHFPWVAERMGDARECSVPRGAVSATRVLREVERGSSVALIGDAAGSVDAVTGEGLAGCFQQAEALAGAIVRGDLEAYAGAHRAISHLPHRMAALLLLMDRYPALQQRALQTLAAQPHLFEELLAVHVGERKLSQFALSHGPQLCWGLLTSSAVQPV
jgi:flavin-dependent dehydrogenase